MSTPVALSDAAHANTTVPDGGQTSHQDDALKHAIEHAAHLLPSQGPITVFIHHNTPHAFEDRPFVEGVEQGARICGRNWATRPTPCARSAGGCGPAGCSSTG